MNDLKVGDTFTMPGIFELPRHFIIECVDGEVFTLKPVPPGDQVAESKENHV